MLSPTFYKDSLYLAATFHFNMCLASIHNTFRSNVRINSDSRSKICTLISCKHWTANSLVGETVNKLSILVTYITNLTCPLLFGFLKRFRFAIFSYFWFWEVILLYKRGDTRFGLKNSLENKMQVMTHITNRFIFDIDIHLS